VWASVGRAENLVLVSQKHFHESARRGAPVKRDAWGKVISETDEAVQGWIASAVDGLASVSMRAPSAEPSAKPEVRAYLMSLAPAPPARERVPPFQFVARYLITTWAADPASEHRALGLLLGAAVEERGEELDLVPPSDEVWRAFGVAPRPALSLTVPVRVQRAVKEAPLVRKPPTLQAVPATGLMGRVLSRDDLPLAGALVKHVDLNVTTRTDRRGTFRFGMVPRGEEDQTLTIYAKGQHQSFVVSPTDGREQPVVIRFAI
jgi:hypothetical protein